MLSIARQIKSLSTAPPDGVRYIPGDSLTEIHAELHGPVGTPYEGGVFAVKLALGAEYPAAPPKGAHTALAPPPPPLSSTSVPITRLWGGGPLLLAPRHIV